MITNERQYAVAKKQAARFQEALWQPDEKRSGLHPKAQKAMRDGAESQLRDLQAEIAEYERLRGGEITAFDADSILGLAGALIKARIARNWTQRELGERLELPEQQIQRYEATLYKGVSMERVQEVADALKLRVREVITIEPL
jgi:HTH-type transcriptional regulator/antitoxin HigA